MLPKTGTKLSFLSIFKPFEGKKSFFFFFLIDITFSDPMFSSEYSAYFDRITFYNWYLFIFDLEISVGFENQF